MPSSGFQSNSFQAATFQMGNVYAFIVQIGMLPLRSKFIRKFLKPLLGVKAFRGKYNPRILIAKIGLLPVTKKGLRTYRMTKAGIFSSVIAGKFTSGFTAFVAAAFQNNAFQIGTGSHAYTNNVNAKIGALSKSSRKAMMVRISYPKIGLYVTKTKKTLRTFAALLGALPVRLRGKSIQIAALLGEKPTLARRKTIGRVFIVKIGELVTAARKVLFIQLLSPKLGLISSKLITFRQHVLLIFRPLLGLLSTAAKLRSPKPIYSFTARLGALAIRKKGQSRIQKPLLGLKAIRIKYYSRAVKALAGLLSIRNKRLGRPVSTSMKVASIARKGSGKLVSAKEGLLVVRRKGISRYVYAKLGELAKLSRKISKRLSAILAIISKVGRGRVRIVSTRLGVGPVKEAEYKNLFVVPTNTSLAFVYPKRTLKIWI
jgi:hypothetical protein